MRICNCGPARCWHHPATASACMDACTRPQVASMDFMMDRTNGKSRGIVLLEFTTAEAAVQCKDQLQG